MSLKELENINIKEISIKKISELSGREIYLKNRIIRYNKIKL